MRIKQDTRIEQELINTRINKYGTIKQGLHVN